MSTIYKGGNIFVAGSAHLDVLANITGDDSVIDKIGNVAIEIGGTACNIATNLAALGLRPRLLTAMQENSPYTGIITAHLRNQGVDVRVMHHSSNQAAVFSAHIDSVGEMISAVSSMPVETAIFPKQYVIDIMAGTRAAILDCNLSDHSLNEFAAIANELGIPVFVASISEEKSLRIANITAPITAVFMNGREAAYFGKRTIASSDPKAIAVYLRCALVVTRDKEGCSIIENGVETFIQPAPLTEYVHTLGAGDALLAATIAHHIFGEISLVDALIKAVSFAAKVIGKANCNAGHGNAIEQALIILDRMATRDMMTGLLNRRAGEQLLLNAHTNAQISETPYSVLMVDIDYFKRINDTYGHDVGDETIKTISAILIQVLRGADMACRWGGEEFICILHGASLNIAIVIAERIRVAIEITDIPTVGKITVSIGVATWNENVMNAAQLIKTADQGLYEAKHNGRNRVTSITRLKTPIQQHTPVGAKHLLPPQLIDNSQCAHV